MHINRYLHSFICLLFLEDGCIVCHPIHTTILAKVDMNSQKKGWYSLGKYLFAVHTNSVLHHSSVSKHYSIVKNGRNSYLFLQFMQLNWKQFFLQRTHLQRLFPWTAKNIILFLCRKEKLAFCSMLYWTSTSLQSWLWKCFQKQSDCAV